VGEHHPAEPLRQAEVQREVELVAQAREVFVDFPCRGVESLRSTQDARAELSGEKRQDLVVVFCVVRDPDQALRGGREQQRADRSVEVGRRNVSDRSDFSRGRCHISGETGAGCTVVREKTSIAGYGAGLGPGGGHTPFTFW
jgi:hypothetical protein